jgi:ABC-type Fe3+ transport system permease subunit
MVDWAVFKSDFWRIACGYRYQIRMGFVLSVTLGGLMALVLPFVDSPGSQVIAVVDVVVFGATALVLGVAMLTCRRRDDRTDVDD